MNDVKRALETIVGKQEYYDLLYDYYTGDHPLHYSSERLKKVFGRLREVKFVENWLSVVVDAVNDKLMFTGWDGKPKDNQYLDNIYNANSLLMEQSDIHKWACVFGESYAIIGQDDKGQPEIYYNDPRMCHIFYEPARPKKKWYGAKIWIADTVKMNLYYDTYMVYYESDATELSDTIVFKEGLTTTYDAMPIFHFRTGRLAESLITKSVQTLQDSVNKLFSDMMVVAEFGAFKQRWIISAADITTLKNSPWEIWGLKPSAQGEQNTQVGEFAETNLNNYMEQIDKLAQAIAVITRTPKHYFMGTGANISGEALLALEAGLNKKVQIYQSSFESTWLQIARYLLNNPDADVTVGWANIESVQPLTEMQIIQTARSSGIPLVTACRRQGWTQQDIEQMQSDMDDEKLRQSAVMKTLLDEKRENEGLNLNE